MPSTEFFLIGGMILVGIVFLLITYSHLLRESAEAKRLQIKAEADEITSLIHRISKDPAPYLRYCQFIKLSNITIEKNKLRYERMGYEFITLLPKNTADAKLIEITELCIIKKDSKISLSGEIPVCELDGICMRDECKEDCPDCYAPASVCVNDGYCNLAIGENCANSPNDCSCGTFGLNYACCPSDPKGNEYGCVDETRQNLDKGEECFCDNECKAGLKCNPTTPDFTAYEKACCEEGKSWNGSDCIAACKKVYKLVFIANNAHSMNAYITRAEREAKIFLEESPWRECPKCINITIAKINCRVSFNNYIGLLNCVNKEYGASYDMLHFVDFSNIANGYCLPGTPVTICSNNIPYEVADYCPIHELGHCMGNLCDEYGYSFWIREGCPPEGWSYHNLKHTGGCEGFGCSGDERCCGTKLKPEDPNDRTVDIMGGGGGWKCPRRDCGVYVYPIHFREWNYERFKSSIPLNEYCGVE